MTLSPSSEFGWRQVQSLKLQSSLVFKTSVFLNQPETITNTSVHDKNKYFRTAFQPISRMFISCCHV